MQTTKLKLKKSKKALEFIREQIFNDFMFTSGLVSPMNETSDRIKLNKTKKLNNRKSIKENWKQVLMAYCYHD